jgi:signal peptidase
MIRANKDDLIVVMLLTAFLSMIEIAINVPVWNTFDLELTFKVITSSVLPIIVQNIILSYLSYNIGYQPVFIYRIIKDILFYILPVIPNLGNYLTCMIGLCLPIVIYLYTSRRLEMYENGIKKKFNSSDFNVFDLIISVFIIVLIILISRAFPVYILGIGTESMTGAINKGDAVIVYKENQEENIRVGDVIVFEKSNKTIVHRVVEIENIDGVLHYSTQGDANNTKDNVDLIFENIEGKVKFKIPYIAYPSIWFSKLIGREI